MKESFTYLNNANPAFIDDLYQQFLTQPDQVEEKWHAFFQGYQLGNGSPVMSSNGHSNTVGGTDIEVNIMKLIHAFRSRGHLIANTNPIRERRRHKADLELSYFNLSESDFDTRVSCGAEIGLENATLADIVAHLNQTYCGAIGAEFMYCSNEHLRQFMYQEMESCANKPLFSHEDKLTILNKLGKAVSFENFLQTKYVGKKRFSLEGLEVVIPALHQAISLSSELGVEECVLGMAHRGRLNVLVNIFEKSYEDVFSEFEEHIVPDMRHTGGDVKYHLGKSADVILSSGKKMHLSLVPNPSHLEAVSPVLQGIVHAKKKHRYGNDNSRILPIVLHGDAAISGQGVNYETSNFSKLEGYENGGTIHIVTNNQVGFTANYLESRSSIYCTEIAKVTESPVFHVNADDPEAVAHVISMAVKVRQQFGCDVYVDILGYRKYGHNEGDEPRFTQPIMYKTIPSHKNVYEKFLDQLVHDQVIKRDEAASFNTAFKQNLQAQLEDAKNNPIGKKPDMFEDSWKGYRMSSEKDFESSVSTGVNRLQLDDVARALTTIPETVALYSKTKKLISSRKDLYFKQQKVDWALAEQLAFGSLLIESHPVRVSGQDSQRGTFSHRHAVIKDVETEAPYIPLNHISSTQANLDIFNSLLSEYGVLAFEYGYSLASAASLVIWEAQFGDFANGAQIVIDQFITASEVKWHRMSGLVLLLPHGYEGQGPEHSSARLERFLQACAEENMYVCNITTPANFFHVLRRQIYNPFRKPLVIMSPKSLLRHPKVVSDVNELTRGQFQEIIDDESIKAPKKIKRVLCCTGKLYYELLEAQPNYPDTAIVRFEQLYPIAKKQVEAIRKKYANASFFWVQEEPENMGAWQFILSQFRSWNFAVISRESSASPSTGNSKIFQKTQQDLVERAFTQK
jgi:2-oxoglutarate dehydrogenase E1 component